jgi:predicted methyltransferase
LSAIVAVSVVAVARPPLPADAIHAQQMKPRRPFPPEDLGLLEGPDRDQWNKPDLIMDALQIAEGDSVADYGAGGGWFTVRLARRVGPNGIVYALDSQQPMLEVIERRVQRENLRNVRTVHGTTTDARLPKKLDAVLIMGSYHEMNEPTKPEIIVSLLGQVARALEPQGRLGVIDFVAGAGGPGPAPEERVKPEEVIAAASSAGLKLLAHEPIPPFIYLLVFGKDPLHLPSGS